VVVEPREETDIVTTQDQAMVERTVLDLVLRTKNVIHSLAHPQLGLADQVIGHTALHLGSAPMDRETVIRTQNVLEAWCVGQITVGTLTPKQRLRQTVVLVQLGLADQMIGHTALHLGSAPMDREIVIRTQNVVEAWCVGQITVGTLTPKQRLQQTVALIQLGLADQIWISGSALHRLILVDPAHWDRDIVKVTQNVVEACCVGYVTAGTSTSQQMKMQTVVLIQVELADQMMGHSALHLDPATWDRDTVMRTPNVLETWCVGDITAGTLICEQRLMQTVVLMKFHLLPCWPRTLLMTITRLQYLMETRWLKVQ